MKILKIWYLPIQFYDNVKKEIVVSTYINIVKVFDCFGVCIWYDIIKYIKDKDEQN